MRALPCTGLREGRSAVKFPKWIVLSASFGQRPRAKCVPESPGAVPTESWSQASAWGFKVLKLAQSQTQLPLEN